MHVGEHVTWSVVAGAIYGAYGVQTGLAGDDVFEIWYTNDNAARELWVDAVNVGGPAPLPYDASLPALRHADGTPEPAPAADEGVTIQAEGGAMLYGRSSFDAPNVVPGQERLDEGGAPRSLP